ncbi:hypothetical protein HZA38_05740 [Candidatus Peregrinibacteria bacterium]|nr:hypothetical protein [Candidatus Peregrinibacteria bacterium]
MDQFDVPHLYGFLLLILEIILSAVIFVYLVQIFKWGKLKKYFQRDPPERRLPL